jgi:hypothetical protein
MLSEFNMGICQEDTGSEDDGKTLQAEQTKELGRVKG